MNFALSFNRAYLDYAIVAITSICESNPGHHDVYILHSELDDGDITRLNESLERYDLSVLPLKVDFDKYRDRLPASDFWSHEIYYRLLRPVGLIPCAVNQAERASATSLSPRNGDTR